MLKDFVSIYTQVQRSVMSLWLSQRPLGCKAELMRINEMKYDIFREPSSGVRDCREMWFFPSNIILIYRGTLLAAPG